MSLAIGIGVVSARIAEAIVQDEHCVLPVGSYREEHGATFSLPTVLGRYGAGYVVMPQMSREERDALRRSAEQIRGALDEAA